jgi:hypothetical protein
MAHAVVVRALVAGSVVPYPCEYDYLCDAGLSIDLSPDWDRPWRPGGGGRN